MISNVSIKSWKLLVIGASCSLRILQGTVGSILVDNMFCLPTEAATACLKLVCSMVSVLGERSNDFAEWLYSSLTKIIKDSGSSKKPNKEKLWRQFYVMRSSDSFVKHWESFMEQLKLKPLPLFIQHVTQEVFETMTRKAVKNWEWATRITQSTWPSSISINHYSKWLGFTKPPLSTASTHFSDVDDM